MKSRRICIVRVPGFLSSQVVTRSLCKSWTSPAQGLLLLRHRPVRRKRRLLPDQSCWKQQPCRLSEHHPRRHLPRHVGFFPLASPSHGKEGVSTLLCNVFEKMNYTLYATVIDGNCIHVPVKHSFVAEGRSPPLPSPAAFSQDAKWSTSSNTIWSGQKGKTVDSLSRRRQREPRRALSSPRRR